MFAIPRARPIDLLISAHALYAFARSFVSAVLLLYLIEEDITISTISAAKAVQLILSISVNVPAGRFTERFGCKSAVMLSCFCSVIYFTCMLQPSTSSVIVGEAFNGVAIALYMGAHENWLFAHKDNGASRLSTLLRNNEAMYFAMMISSVFGALYWNFALYAAIVFTILTGILFSCIPNAPCNNSVQPKTPMLGIFQFILMPAVIPYILIAACLQLQYQFWPSFLMQATGGSISKDMIGIAFGICMLSQMVASRGIRWLHLHCEKYTGKIILTGLTLSGAIITAEHNNIISIGMATFLYCLYAVLLGAATTFMFSLACEKNLCGERDVSFMSGLDAGGRALAGLALWAIAFSGFEDTSRLFSAVLPALCIAAIGYRVIPSYFGAKLVRSEDK